MLQAFVVDRSVESRQNIVTRLEKVLEDGGTEANLIPKITIRPVASEELRFHAAPEICIVGPEIIGADPPEIARIRKLLPQTVIVGVLDKQSDNLSSVEQLVRLGIDDLIDQQLSGAHFLRKLMLLLRKSPTERHGTLVVVTGGKGGVGVTSLCAALGEAAMEAGKSTVLVDCDHDTQDLSRFLQVRPFVNESLQLLLEHNRPMTEESVAECLAPVWADENGLQLMSPCASAVSFESAGGRVVRTLLSVLECVDARADLVIVDCAGARGFLLEMLCRAADKVVLVANSDPASFFASLQKLQQLSAIANSDLKPVIVLNSTGRDGLSPRHLKGEFEAACAKLSSSISLCTIPYSRRGSRWPGAGTTLFSEGGRGIELGIRQLLEHLGLAESESKTDLKFGTKVLTLLASAVSTKKIKLRHGAPPPISAGIKVIENRELLALPTPLTEALLEAPESFVSGVGAEKI